MRGIWASLGVLVLAASCTLVDQPRVERDLRIYDVDGVEVVAITELEELPRRASMIEYRARVTDAGDGPRICLHRSYAGSLPAPPCRGPVVDGLKMSGWGGYQVSGSGDYHLTGDRTVVMTWPPRDNRVALIDDREFDFEFFASYPRADLHRHCRDIEDFLDNKFVRAYSELLGNRSGGTYLTYALANDPVLVLQVVDDPEPHRAGLGSGGRDACVVQVDHTEEELRRLRSELSDRLWKEDIAPNPLFHHADFPDIGPGGRLEIVVAVADLEAVEAITEMVDDPTTIRIIGRGVIID